jgi:peptide/nickel transport system permease protein
MIGFVLRRLLQGVAILFAVVTLTFALLHLAPGEPLTSATLEPRLSPEVRAHWRARYGLDRPLPEQYLRYLSRVAQGDLGESFVQRRTVRAVLADALPRTLLLMGTALVVGFGAGIVIGAAQAARAGSRFDRLAARCTIAVAALPEFWLALGLMFLCSYRLRWFPVSGMVSETMHDYLSPAGRVADVLHHLVLPALSLALIIAGVVARHQRAALLDVLPDDYVRTARAKGLTPRAVLMRHALRNALLPIITLAGLSLPTLVGGAVFVEAVFAWPGMGRTAIDALAARDYPVVLACALTASALVIAGNVLADALYAAVDPRLRDA